ncbi:MAG TPA: hypothetical protein VFH67_08595 [bacterium]|nr:hypothetical protein [bacterium]
MHQARLAVLIAITLVFGVSSVAYAPYHTQPARPPSTPAPSGMSVVKAQAKIAGTHAGFAAGSATMSSAKEHLAHVIACIEGSKGRNVKPQWMNPCSGNGNGVLVDLRRIKASASLIRAAQDADATAVAAIRNSNLTQVKNSARRVGQLTNRIATAK